VAVELPEDVWGMIVGRSSTFFKRGLIVNSAVIDQGYRGDLFACVFNPGPEGAWAKAGERLAQLIPMPLLSPGIATVRVEVLDRSDRGDAGFGSSGG
jgi:dUTP pyrophosphatase